MLEINVWQALVPMALTLAAFVAIAIVTARPGERAFFVGLALTSCAMVVMVAFGVGWLTGWLVLVS
jgi:hypothetical protein